MSLLSYNSFKRKSITRHFSSLGLSFIVFFEYTEESKEFRNVLVLIFDFDVSVFLNITHRSGLSAWEEASSSEETISFKILMHRTFDSHSTKKACDDAIYTGKACDGVSYRSKDLQILNR